MYLVRIYRNHQRRAVGLIRKEKLCDAMAWLCEQIESQEGGRCSRATVVDLKHKTAILVWNVGLDGRPQHPVVPGQGRG